MNGKLATEAIAGLVILLFIYLEDRNCHKSLCNGSNQRSTDVSEAVSSVLQAEAREGLQRLQPGLASVWQAAGVHGHRGLPGPAGRGEHLHQRR